MLAKKVLQLILMKVAFSNTSTFFKKLFVLHKVYNTGFVHTYSFYFVFAECSSTFALVTESRCSLRALVVPSLSLLHTCEISLRTLMIFGNNMLLHVKLEAELDCELKMLSICIEKV